MNGIDRIIGSVEGGNVVFNFNEQTGTWDAQVPSLPSGEYVVEVTVYDYAGNTAYTATMLFIIELDKIQVRTLNLDYTGEFKNSPFRWTIATNRYQSTIKNKYQVAERKKYSFLLKAG